jgi:hypothetical protein
MERPKRIHELLIRLEDDDLSPEQTAELTLLLEDGSSHRHLLEYLTFKTTLRNPQIPWTRS